MLQPQDVDKQGLQKDRQPPPNTDTTKSSSIARLARELHEPIYQPSLQMSHSCFPDLAAWGALSQEFMFASFSALCNPEELLWKHLYSQPVAHVETGAVRSAGKTLLLAFHQALLTPAPLGTALHQCVCSVSSWEEGMGKFFRCWVIQAWSFSHSVQYFFIKTLRNPDASKITVAELNNS